MGMYDCLWCKYPLQIEGANALCYQTKNTPEQFLDIYEIREDGTLWVQRYDTEDRSDKNAEGLMAFVGCMTRVNQRWERSEFTGEIRFYTTLSDDNPCGWIEWSSYFVKGELKQLHLIKHEKP